MCQIKFIYTLIYYQLPSKNRHYIYTIENQPWKCIIVVAATGRWKWQIVPRNMLPECTLISQSSPELLHISRKVPHMCGSYFTKLQIVKIHNETSDIKSDTK